MISLNSQELCFEISPIKNILFLPVTLLAVSVAVPTITCPWTTGRRTFDDVIRAVAHRCASAHVMPLWCEWTLIKGDKPEQRHQFVVDVDVYASVLVWESTRYPVMQVGDVTLWPQFQRLSRVCPSSSQTLVKPNNLSCYPYHTIPLLTSFSKFSHSTHNHYFSRTWTTYKQFNLIFSCFKFRIKLLHYHVEKNIV